MVSAERLDGIALYQDRGNKLSIVICDKFRRLQRKLPAAIKTTMVLLAVASVPIPLKGH